MTEKGDRTIIPALRVRQWLTEWDKIKWNPQKGQGEPKETFLLFTLPAEHLRGLCGIRRRTTAGELPRAQDLGIQRNFNSERATEISRFVKVGYPCSELDPSRLKGELEDLRKPGWLPTAIVLNILPEGARRGTQVLSAKNAVIVRDSAGKTTLDLPTNAPLPGELPPLEIIDGQHRLYSFSANPAPERYELPVVAFEDLGVSWQAYLFWTINIKPKRISASMAFDLYPLLRTEDWLERFSHYVYRETRAQELVEAMWSHPKSPWRGQINMLGETRAARGDQRQMVSQAAWIRSLTTTFIRAFEGRAVRVGGIFGAPSGKDQLVIPWNRAQQAAFLLYSWDQVRLAISRSTSEWALDLRGKEPADGESGTSDLAFSGHLSLLTTDQGIRGVHYAFNDLCFVRADALKLRNWVSSDEAAATDTEAVDFELKGLVSQSFAPYLRHIADRLADYDWRTSAVPDLPPDLGRSKAALRGGTGYRLLREDLLNLLEGGKGDIRTAASEVKAALGYVT